MEFYAQSLSVFRRLKTREVRVGNLLIGGDNPVRIQTMTTTDTMDTEATVAQTIRCIEAGAELVRITAPSKNEAENLQKIKDELNRRGYFTPLVADIHFTPNAAEIAARIVEKVRVNPGNYVDKKKFEQIDYTDEEYAAEIERIRERFTPLVKICLAHGTAMRIGTNHGSLSDRIMSRYGDTAIGMVESAMEFLRIARAENYHAIILSMKSSNPLVMVQAYRLLITRMQEEFGECYPLHLGVTEAGDGEDGRIKSAIGIGTLMEDGIGDTIRVSLTEDPEFEIPVCRDLVSRYSDRAEAVLLPAPVQLPTDNALQIQPAYSPYSYSRRLTQPVRNIGERQVPVVVADFTHAAEINRGDLESIGYRYDLPSDKWHISDSAADYIFTGNKKIDFALPGTLGVICNYEAWQCSVAGDEKCFPLLSATEYAAAQNISPLMNFISVDADADCLPVIEKATTDPTAVFCIYSAEKSAMQKMRTFINDLMRRGCKIPVIIVVKSDAATIDSQLIAFSATAGGLLLDGMGDGIWLMNDPARIVNLRVSGRTYLPAENNYRFLNNTSFSILQAVRTRISRTEYISCPSCGRTLFDLQETTTRIRNVTNHLKGLKIAVMGCIVNGPGEMADADFGYVGSGVGKITLYRGKEVIKRNVESEVAVEELVNLLKESGVWLEA